VFAKVTKANELLKTELEKTTLRLRKQGDETENLYTALGDLEQYTGPVHQEKQPKNSRYTGSVLFYNWRGSIKIGKHVKS